jgi:hypothetical protein
MSWAVQAVIAAIIFAAGGAAGIKWHAGQDAIAAKEAQELRESDARQMVAIADTAATRHAKALATLNNQLGNAREKIASLSGRECFDADTAGVLNTIGSEPVPAAAGEPAGTPPAVAAGTGLRFTTDRDAAGYIALCRARYAEVSSQVNQILDIEEARHQPDQP